MSNQPVNCIVAANAIIINQNKFLLIKHNRPERATGKYWLVWGKIEIWETFIEWLIREIEEETGIKVLHTEIKKLCILHESPEITCKHIYLVQRETLDNDFKFDKNEVQSIDWIEWDIVKNMNTNNFRKDRVQKIISDFVDWKFNKWNFIYS